MPILFLHFVAFPFILPFMTLCNQFPLLNTVMSN